MSRTKISTVHIDQINSLKKLAIQDLVVFYDACEGALDGAQGVMNQPRTSDDAHSMIEALLTEHCGLLIGATIEELQRRKPTTECDLELRNGCLASYQILGGEYSSAVKTLLDIGIRPTMSKAAA